MPNELLEEWLGLPFKGPELSEEELNNLRMKILENRPFSQEECRRLLQSYERWRFGTPKGTTLPLPKVGETVYIQEGSDNFECKVLRHVGPGEIVVDDQSLPRDHRERKKIIRSWSTKPEPLFP